MRYFFFGTLMDPELRAVVLGREVPEGALGLAFLRDHARYCVAGEAFPLMVAEPDARVDGVLAKGIGPEEAARIAWYESDEYEIREIEVQTVDGRATEAFCCLAGPRARHDGIAWDFAHWQRHDRHFALLLAHDWMGQFGSADVDLAERNYQRRKRRLLGGKAATGPE